MYLMIYETGDMVRLCKVTKDDLTLCEDGVIDLLDVSVADKPLRYWDGKWKEIQIANAGV